MKTLLPLLLVLAFGTVAAPLTARASASTSTTTTAAEVPASEAPREIAALLALLRSSSCRFQRNGRWYDGEKAAEHLQRKLDYAVARGQALGSTELFIELAATRSSFSGKPYRVKCGEAAEIAAADWFLARLQELRTP